MECHIVGYDTDDSYSLGGHESFNTGLTSSYFTKEHVLKKF